MPIYILPTHVIVTRVSPTHHMPIYILPTHVIVTRVRPTHHMPIHILPIHVIVTRLALPITCLSTFSLPML